MIVRPSITRDEIIERYAEKRSETNQKYATFKAIDLKTGDHIEVACDPKGLSNYFEPESTLPLEMSPAFFRAEVLHKYKADPEKYDLQDRSIYCRGTWSLKPFDITPDGQVHTYLRYLGMIPYSEQVYWQAFNEWPKGSISERAYTTDFRGEIYLGRDPLNALKRKIIRLNEAKPAWWQPRDDELIKAVRIPATTSPAEWADEVLALDQLVNEGFQLKPLQALAQTLGRSLEAEWKQFALLEECLKANGTERDEAKRIISSLRSVRELRNVLKGHAAIDKRRAAERGTRERFGSFRAHFEDMTERVGEALEIIMGALLQTS